MNIKKLESAMGMVLSLLPTPKRDRRSRSTLDRQYNKWLLVDVVTDKKVVKFKNAISEHFFEIGFDSIREFRSPEIIVLRGQVYLEGDNVEFEPFVPAPHDMRELYVGGAQLDLVVNAVKEMTASASSMLPLDFQVLNSGDRGVNEFETSVFLFSRVRRNEVFLPPVPGNLTRSGDVSIGQDQYVAFTSHVARTLFPDRRRNIGVISIVVPTQDVRILWQIAIDDAFFPARSVHGELWIRVQRAQ